MSIQNLEGGEVTVDIAMGRTTADGELAYLVRGLEPGMTYYWKVEAVDEGGLSSFSAVRSFTVAEAGRQVSGTATVQ